MKKSGREKVLKKGKSLLSKEKIDKWIRKKPGGIYFSVSAGIHINLFLKFIFILALLGLTGLLYKQQEAILIITSLLFLSIALTILDYRFLNKVRYLQYKNTDLFQNLESLQFFLKSEYSVYRLFSSLTNPILILTGALYYDYFKYGRMNVFGSGESALIFSIFPVLGYILGYFANRYSDKQIEIDIDSYIEQLDADQLKSSAIEKIRNRKIKNILWMISILAVGLIFFIVFWKLNQT